MSEPHPPRLQTALADLRTLHRATLASPEFAEPRGEIQERLLARFEQLLEALEQHSTDYEYLGRELLSTLQAQFPDIWPLVDRHLLWFFGGDCLHFLTEEEIAEFQARDDAATT
jgi:hypothetical protein